AWASSFWIVPVPVPLAMVALEALLKLTVKEIGRASCRERHKRTAIVGVWKDERAGKVSGRGLLSEAGLPGGLPAQLVFPMAVPEAVAKSTLTGTAVAPVRVTVRVRADVRRSRASCLAVWSDGLAWASSFWIVPVPVPLAMVALEALLKLTVK